MDQPSFIVQHETLGWICLQKEFVISRYDDFVPMCQFTEPIIEVDNCFHTLENMVKSPAWMKMSPSGTHPPRDEADVYR
jgi:hypothetical protein